MLLKQSEALVSDSYEYKQALSYESAANQLLAEAKEYRPRHNQKMMYLRERSFWRKPQVLKLLLSKR